MSRQTIVLATNNPGKVDELQRILASTHYEIMPQSDYGVPDIAEDGLTFVENALIKARNAARHTGLPAIADDSGIAVDALGGQPGIFSARYAGEGASDADNLNLLLDNMKEVPDNARQARFICLLVYLRDAGDPHPTICEGVWHGELLRFPHGENGFGYDPVFFVPEQGCSSAELSREIKNTLSHRGQALRCLMEMLN